MLQYLIIPYGRLREVKNKRRFQTFSSRSGRGRLQEVVAYKRFQIQ